MNTVRVLFGKPTRQIGQDTFRLNDGIVEIVNSWKYLGFYLTNGKFAFNCSEERKSFYRASNSVINALYKSSEEVSTKLLFSNCVPILAYGLDVKEYLTCDERSIRCHE